MPSSALEGKPLTADDDRPVARRQAEALADACGYVLDHGDRIRDGLPEFIPPGWIDPQRRPRRRPLPHLLGVA